MDTIIGSGSPDRIAWIIVIWCAIMVGLGWLFDVVQTWFNSSMKVGCFFRVIFHIGPCKRCPDCGRCNWHGAACKNVAKEYDWDALAKRLTEANIYDKDGFER